MQVSNVQCRFILQMLGYSNFNKHLSAVRETHNILRRAQEFSRTDQGKVMRRVNSWLQEHSVVAQLLRSNLHQRQYVDQVSEAPRSPMLSPTILGSARNGTRLGLGAFTVFQTIM